MIRDLLQEYASRCSDPEQLSAVDKFYQLLETTQGDCFGRQPGGHITASAWVVSRKGTTALLTHHKKFNMWLQLGGHCDGDTDVVAAALREAQEESGMQDVTLLVPGIFDLDIHAIPSACAFHYDVRFLLQAQTDTFIVSDESHDLAWVNADSISIYSQERAVLRMAQKYLDSHKGNS